ncbi:MAG: hypothetical protein LZF60_30051 [Nitrospira sp.]|nr:MAG: hypothetical protein LZF60_30051 [Nitrospira sp.]
MLDLLPVLLLRSSKRPPIIQTPQHFLQTAEGWPGLDGPRSHQGRGTDFYEQLNDHAPDDFFRCTSAHTRGKCAGTGY